MYVHMLYTVFCPKGFSYASKTVIKAVYDTVRLGLGKALPKAGAYLPLCVIQIISKMN